MKWLGSWRSTILGRSLKVSVTSGLCTDILFRPFQCSQIDYNSVFSKIIEAEELQRQGKYFKQNIYLPLPRIEEQLLTCKVFETEYVDRPFILTNKDPKRWPQWTIESLLQRYPDVEFQQESVKWKLSAYVDYLQSNIDESPLYLFDCKSPAVQELSREYTAPQAFQKDLFSVLPCRPNYRWLIVGSCRTGSTFHKDPNATSAWNAVLSGKKLWAMVPPGMTPPGVNTDAAESEVTSPVSLAEYVLSGFFNDLLKLSQDAATGVLIGVTFPGECMYVPNGWWHLVINLEDTVALTQNFTPVTGLAKVLRFLKTKPEQISGFDEQEVRETVQALLMDVSCEAHKHVFEDFLAQAPVICTDDEEVQAPVYEMFQELLLKNGYVEELEAATKTLQPVSNNKKKVWDSVVDSSAQFLFNFDLE